MSRVTSQILDRMPPANLEAEMACLGSMLIAPDCIDDVSLAINADDFYDDANARLFAALADMRGSGKAIDSALLLERLRRDNDLEVIGGMGYVARVANSVITPAHATYYAQIVRQKSIFRQLISAGTEIVKAAYAESGSPEDALAEAESAVLAIGERAVAEAAPVSFREAMHEAFEAIDARREIGSGGIATGLNQLDRMTGGFKPGQLVIVAARPSMGKTALGHNIAEEAAAEHATLFVSLEMSASELVERALSSQAHVDSYHMRKGYLSEDERRRLMEASPRLAELKWHVIDTPGMSIAQIGAHARRLKHRSGLELVIIDYLNLIEPDNPKDPRQEQVAKISRRLKLLAKELKVPVVCLAQLNRQTESAKENKPRLSHLRESGAIEQDADMVIFCHRPGYYTNQNTPPGSFEDAELIVAKQRNGPTGDIPVKWFPSFTRWEDKADERWQSARYSGDGPNRTEAFDDYNRKDCF